MNVGSQGEGDTKGESHLQTEMLYKREAISTIVTLRLWARRSVAKSSDEWRRNPLGRFEEEEARLFRWVKLTPNPK